MKKLLLISLMFIGVNSFAAITEQDKAYFKSLIGQELPAKLSAKLFDFCEKNNTGCSKTHIYCNIFVTRYYKYLIWNIRLYRRCKQFFFF